MWSGWRSGSRREREVTPSVVRNGSAAAAYSRRMEVVGFDAWKRGWVGIRLVDGRYAGSSVHEDFESAVGAYPNAAVITVDMPLGLASETEWSREADVAAARFVGPRRSSVFAMPPQVVLEAESHEAAVALCRSRSQKGVSIQAYGLRAKLFDVNRVGELDDRVFEVHPEVCFRAMAGEPLAHGKKGWAGVMLRRRLLDDAGVCPPEDVGVASDVPPDDVLDATAAAWSATRIATGRSARDARR